MTVVHCTLWYTAKYKSLSGDLRQKVRLDSDHQSQSQPGSMTRLVVTPVKYFLLLILFVKIFFIFKHFLVYKQNNTKIVILCPLKVLWLSAQVTQTRNIEIKQGLGDALENKKFTILNEERY